jgi:hypothetical protein
MSDRLLTSAIATGRKLPLTGGRIDFLQDNIETLTSSIAKGLIGSYTTNDVIILHGCTITGSDPGARTLTAGAIYYNGIIYQVDAASFTTTGSNIPLWTIVSTLSDQATFTDGYTNDPGSKVRRTQKFVLVAGPAGGSGVSGYVTDYNSAIVKKIYGDVHAVGSSGEPAFQNSWVAISGTSLKFYKTSSGRVFISGIIKNGTTGTVCTLPAGYRPTSLQLLVCHKGDSATYVDANLTPIHLNIYTSGAVEVYIPSGTYPTDSTMPVFIDNSFFVF